MIGRNRSMSHQLIAITGFMASGKTTVASALAARLNCKFIDLDEVIAARQQKTIKEIIEADGEDCFRRLETNALAEVLRENESQVIALGGGTWTIAENRGLLQKHTARVVWLDTPFELCWQRIIEAGTRPLARSRQTAVELFRARRPVYETAEMRLVVLEDKTPEEIAKKIAAAFLQGNSHS